MLLLSLLPGCVRWEHLAERNSSDATAIYRIRYATAGGPWVRATTYDLPAPPVQMTMQADVSIDPSRLTPKTSGLMVSALAHGEVYWDGELLGSLGRIDNFFPLTAGQTTPGPHLLTLHLNAPNLDGATTMWFYGIGIGDYEQMVRAGPRSQILPMVAAGAFLVVAIWYFAVWSSFKRRSLLAFSMLSLAAALLTFAEAYRPMFGYPFEYHIARLVMVSLLTIAVCALLPLFLALELEIRRPLLRVAALVPILFTPFLATSYDSACLSMFTQSMIASSAMVISRMRTWRWRILPLATGIAILTGALIAGGYRFNDEGFFLAFAALIICLLISLSLDLRRQKAQHEAALVRASRLEAELLKKSIQPHFVMNTLTAVMEWIEENPREGVRFLESLAEELRIFLEIAGRPFIPVQQEIELCRAHLRIMSCRKGVRFEFHSEELRGDAPVPPAIFHTLVENAISHNSYEEERVDFRLREERLKDSRRYVFSAPLRHRENHQRSGLGMRYVQTRLEESYPGRWSLESSASGDRWETRIEVPA